MTVYRWIAPLSLVLTSCSSALGSSPEELGKIRWGRDLAEAQKKAAKTHKPIFLLFDEVPGCDTVRGFGREVLSNPEIVEVVETHFVPVAIFNNVRGRDREVLESFGEPSWNNPVVRIIDAERKELAPRFAGPYTVKALARTLIRSLEKLDRPIPDRLQRLTDNRPTSSEVIVGMYCFWEGEAQLGGLEGVTETSVGFLDGREVVVVKFDPNKTSEETLLKEATRRRVADVVFVRSREEQARAQRAVSTKVVLTDDRFLRSEKDEKYYLKRSKLQDLELGEAQASRINAALRRGESVVPYLTENQREALSAARTIGKKASD